MKEAFKTLPPADYLLYEKVHEYVNSLDSCNSQHQKNIIEQKILYIIQSLSLYYYGMPIFRDDFIAYKEGPIIEKIRTIQGYKNKVTKKPQHIDKENIKYYENVSSQLLNLIKDSVKQGVFSLNSKELSDITHTEEWAKKFEQREQEPDIKRKNKLGHMVDQDLLKFLVGLKETHGEFIRYVEQELWG